MKRVLVMLVMVSALQAAAEGMVLVCESPMQNSVMTARIDSERMMGEVFYGANSELQLIYTGSVKMANGQMVISHQPTAIDWLAPEYVDVCSTEDAAYSFVAKQDESSWTAHYMIYPIVYRNPYKTGCPPPRRPHTPAPLALNCMSSN